MQHTCLLWFLTCGWHCMSHDILAFDVALLVILFIYYSLLLALIYGLFVIFIVDVQHLIWLAFAFRIYICRVLNVCITLDLWIFYTSTTYNFHFWKVSFTFHDWQYEACRIMVKINMSPSVILFCSRLIICFCAEMRLLSGGSIFIAWIICIVAFILLEVRCTVSCQRKLSIL